MEIKMSLCQKHNIAMPDNEPCPTCTTENLQNRFNEYKKNAELYVESTDKILTENEKTYDDLKDQLEKKDKLLKMFVGAAKKQKIALNEGLGHALICNFQVPPEKCPRCNCGINDLQSALTEHERQCEKQHEIPKEFLEALDWMNLSHEVSEYIKNKDNENKN